MRINQNIMAFNAYRNLSITNDNLAGSLEKLSSGFRINRAADDAAGLVISEGLRAQIGGLQTATRNVQDGVSVVQTAEGALTEVHAMLQRMRDLAVQSANTGSMSTEARQAAQAEVDALVEEIDRIGTSTKFGGVKLLDGAFGAAPASTTGFDADDSVTVATGDDFTIAVDGAAAVTVELVGGTYDGAGFAAHLESAIKNALVADGQTAAADTISVVSERVGDGASISIQAALGDTETFALVDGTNTPLAGLSLDGAVTAADGAGGLFQVGANQGESITVTIGAVSATGLGVNALDLENDAAAAIDLVDTAIGTISTQRGDLGALQNRFEHTLANLQVTTENLMASESRIRDTDMALQMTQFTRNQILQQAGTAMLAQANSVPQSVLQLLR